MSAITVKLTLDECLHAAIVGCRRRISMLKADSTRIFNGVDPWGQEIESSAAEEAVAKALGMYWGCHEGIGKAPDVGKLQVRRIDDPRHKLIIRVRDDPNHVFVLAHGSIPEFTVIGHALAAHVMRDEFLRNPETGTESEPAYFVPQSELSDDWSVILPGGVDASTTS